MAALRSVYAPRFLDFLPSHLGRILRGRMERCFARHPNAGNSYARALLLGDAPDDAGTAAANVLLRQADAASFLESEPAGSFDGFTLSNILDGADAHYRQRLFAAVRRAATPGAAVVLRSFAEPEAPLATNHAAGDRSMLWGIVDVRPAAAL